MNGPATGKGTSPVETLDDLAKLATPAAPRVDISVTPEDIQFLGDDGASVDCERRTVPIPTPNGHTSNGHTSNGHTSNGHAAIGTTGLGDFPGVAEAVRAAKNGDGITADGLIPLSDGTIGETIDKYRAAGASAPFAGTAPKARPASVAPAASPVLPDEFDIVLNDVDDKAVKAGSARQVDKPTTNQTKNDWRYEVFLDNEEQLPRTERDRIAGGSIKSGDTRYVNLEIGPKAKAESIRFALSADADWNDIKAKLNDVLDSKPKTLAVLLTRLQGEFADESFLVYRRDEGRQIHTYVHAAKDERTGSVARTEWNFIPGKDLTSLEMDKVFDAKDPNKALEVYLRTSTWIVDDRMLVRNKDTADNSFAKLKMLAGERKICLGEPGELSLINERESLQIRGLTVRTVGVGKADHDHIFLQFARERAEVELSTAKDTVTTKEVDLNKETAQRIKDEPIWKRLGRAIPILGRRRIFSETKSDAEKTAAEALENAEGEVTEAELALGRTRPFRELQSDLRQAERPLDRHYVTVDKLAQRATDEEDLLAIRRMNTLGRSELLKEVDLRATIVQERTENLAEAIRKGLGGALIEVLPSRPGKRHPAADLLPALEPALPDISMADRVPYKQLVSELKADYHQIAKASLNVWRRSAAELISSPHGPDDEDALVITCNKPQFLVWGGKPTGYIQFQPVPEYPYEVKIKIQYPGESEPSVHRVPTAHAAHYMDQFLNNPLTIDAGIAHDDSRERRYPAPGQPFIPLMSQGGTPRLNGANGGILAVPKEKILTAGTAEGVEGVTSDVAAKAA